MILRNSLPDLSSIVRFFHAAAGAGPVDIYANKKILIKNISFSQMKPYIKLSPGEYTFEIYETGTHETALFMDKITLLPNSISTLCVVLLESEVTLLKLKDGSTSKNPDLTLLRFINLSPNSPLLSLSPPNSETIFTGVEYLETTGYYPLSSGIFDFELTATNDSSFRKYIGDLNLTSGTFYTIYILGLLDESPRFGYYLSIDGEWKYEFRI